MLEINILVSKSFLNLHSNILKSFLIKLNKTLTHNKLNLLIFSINIIK